MITDNNLLLADDNQNTSLVEQGFIKLMTWLHKQKQFTVEMLKKKEVKDFINATKDHLIKGIDKGIEKTQISDTLRNKLEESAGVFSSFKTFHEMNEAAGLLYTENGEIKPFEQFSNDVRKLNNSYNKQYLKAEYGFAVGSAQMATKWEKFSKKGNRYYLQYRTENDDLVRPEHRKLHNTTLPIDDPFWRKYYPPNGWGCRCDAVLVLKSKYTLSDSKEAIKIGDEATAGKHSEMFRFNPGIEQAAYPAYNGYTIKTCAACSKAGYPNAVNPKNELCKACKLIRKIK